MAYRTLQGEGTLGAVLAQDLIQALIEIDQGRNLEVYVQSESYGDDVEVGIDSNADYITIRRGGSFS